MPYAFLRAVWSTRARFCTHRTCMVNEWQHQQLVLVVMVVPAVAVVLSAIDIVVVVIFVVVDVVVLVDMS